MSGGNKRSYVLKTCRFVLGTYDFLLSPGIKGLTVIITYNVSPSINSNAGTGRIDGILVRL